MRRGREIWQNKRHPLRWVMYGAAFFSGFVLGKTVVASSRCRAFSGSLLNRYLPVNACYIALVHLVQAKASVSDPRPKRKNIASAHALMP